MLQCDREAWALSALREALRHLPLARVRFDTGRTGANLFRIRDLIVRADRLEDNGVIMVLLEPAEP